MTTLADAPDYDSERFVATTLLDGSQSNVRVIRLSPGQVLPPHTHSTSDLMIYIVEGSDGLDIDGGKVAFVAGSLAFFRSDEELRPANNGAAVAGLIENVRRGLTRPERLDCLNPTSSNGGS